VGEFGEDVHHGTLIQRKICLQPSDLMANFRTCPENQILSKNLKNVFFGVEMGPLRSENHPTDSGLTNFSTT
jgi:hypothetical protein